MRILLLVALAACGQGTNPCDSAQLSFTCSYTNGQCVEFTGLSTADRDSNQTDCATRHGTALNGVCTTTGRLGTCVIPANGQNTGVTCSPSAHISIRYFAPETQSGAQAECTNVVNSVWTPN